MYFIGALALLTVVYLVLSANAEAGNVILGVVVVSGILYLLHPGRRRVAWRSLPSASWALVRYLAILIYDLVASGIQVARIVLDPAMPISPGIIAIPSDCRSELETALSMHAVSLTPGELVIEIDDEGVMYTHCLDATHSERVQADAQRLRNNLLRKIFPES